MRLTLPSLSPFDLIRALSSADAPTVLDIRLPEDVDSHPGTIPSAVPVAYDDIEAQVKLAQPNGAVLVCHKGLKLSAGATARLLSRGIAAWRVKGGHVAWLADGLPVISAPPPQMIALALDATPTEAAAAWAMLRFIAPQAELLEVPRNDLAGVSERFSAMCPAASDAPTLPGLAALLEEAATMGGIFSAQLRGVGLRPSAAFACLDAAYRGRLEALKPDNAATPATANGELSA